MQETAYAKINLALHVRRRREDGYHELETLFAFVDAGDVLSARVADEGRVTTVGEFASGIDNPLDNLVARALSMLPRSQGLDITLQKNLPVAAGLGGGSADAGAVFRLIERLHDLPDDWPELAAKLGADVPSCVRSAMAIGYGIGTELGEVDNDLAGTATLLVNPRVPLATPPVYKGWDQQDRGPLPSGSARTITLEGRNDLFAPALKLCPVIKDVLKALETDQPWLSRMSGSGATCFALYDNEAARDDAALRLKQEHPDWWLLAGKLR